MARGMGTSGRNITDFFKPFSQPRSSQFQSSASDHAQGANLDSDLTVCSSPASRAPSPAAGLVDSNERKVPLLSPVSSYPPTPTPDTQEDAPTRLIRELSPLSSLGSETPDPPRPLPESALSNPALLLDPSTSLSSLPISSQNSSKRIIKGSMWAVTNSDSDSIDADSDPLDDIDELIRKKRMNMTPAGISEASKPPSPKEERELRSSRRDRPSAIKRKPNSPPPRKKYKFSLASLAASSARDAALDKKIKQYEEEQQSDAHQIARLEAKNSPKMGAEEFANRLQQDESDDDEKKDRLVRALKRNDVLEKDAQYHFFRQAAPTFHKHQPFPIKATSQQGWASVLKDPYSREESFKTGFAADVARISALPDEIIEWILSEVLHESDSDLGNGYVRALENTFGNTPFSTRHLRLHLLQRAGREDLDQELFSEETIRHSPHQRPFVDELPINITWACLFLTRIADKLRIAERRDWLPILMLLLIDPKVGQDVETRKMLQASIIALLDADESQEKLTATIEYVGQRILSQMANPVLIQRLVYLLPSYTASLHTFKRRLSLSSFLKSQDYLSDSLDDISTMVALTTYLKKNSKFKIKENTDYSILGARFGILDVAIGSGFSESGFPNSEPIVMADSPVDVGAVRSRPPPSVGEQKFDSALDKLVAELRLIAFNIRDAGATMMRRTECKTAIEKLAYRLEYSVRSRPKPKKGIFGTEAGSSEMIRAFVDRREDTDTNMMFQ